MKSKVIIIGLLVATGVLVTVNSYVRNTLPTEVRESISYCNFLSSLDSAKTLAHYGINSHTPLFRSETSLDGAVTLIYLSDTNLPKYFTVESGTLQEVFIVEQSVRDNILQLATAMFGGDVICSIPDTYEDEIVVNVRGESYVYEDRTLTKMH